MFARSRRFQCNHFYAQKDAMLVAGESQPSSAQVPELIRRAVELQGRVIHLVVLRVATWGVFSMIRFRVVVTKLSKLKSHCPHI